MIYDRCLQAQAAAALEPEWEAGFEAKSYGFRPGRGCQDAIAAIFWTVAGSVRERVRACSGLEQFGVWAQRAVHATNAEDLFGDEGVWLVAELFAPWTRLRES